MKIGQMTQSQAPRIAGDAELAAAPIAPQTQQKKPAISDRLDPNAAKVAPTPLQTEGQPKTGLDPVQAQIAGQTGAVGGAVVPDGLSSFLSPAAVLEIQARIKDIDKVFLAGFVSAELSQKLTEERAQLVRLLLSATLDVDPLGGLMSEELSNEIQARIDDIDQVMLAGFVSPELETELVAERAKLHRFLLIG